MQAHWAVPERILGVLPYIYISHTRLAAFLLPKFYSTVSCGVVTPSHWMLLVIFQDVRSIVLQSPQTAYRVCCGYMTLLKSNTCCRQHYRGAWSLSRTLHGAHGGTSQRSPARSRSGEHVCIPLKLQYVSSGQVHINTYPCDVYPG